MAGTTPCNLLCLPEKNECFIANPAFVVYSSIVSFYVPFIVTLLVYVQIYIVLRKRRKRVNTKRTSHAGLDSDMQAPLKVTGILSPRPLLSAVILPAPQGSPPPFPPESVLLSMSEPKTAAGSTNPARTPTLAASLLCPSHWGPAWCAFCKTATYSFPKQPLFPHRCSTVPGLGVFLSPGLSHVGDSPPNRICTHWWAGDAFKPRTRRGARVQPHPFGASTVGGGSPKARRRLGHG